MGPVAHGMWALPETGIEPVFLALQGGFLTTELPGKPHSSILARKIPSTEEPGGVHSMALQTTGHD